MAGKYDDIINLPHHQSDRHPHMSLHDRAAQFSPFAALTGHKGVIEEAQRQTESFRQLDESQMAFLDGKLQILQENRSSKPEVRIWHFVPDTKKKGGAYLETAGRFQKVDGRMRQVIMEDGTAISIEEIRDIQSDLFEGSGLE